MLVYTRADHGSYPVQVSEGGLFKVGFPSGERTYEDPQLLLRAVYYGPEIGPTYKSVPISFERYFRLGRYLKAPRKGPDVFDLLSAPAVRSAPVLGIDINARYIEIRRVFFKLVAKKVIAQGFDPEDVLQEVCRGLVVRNHGKCPFDARKSSFAHYVVMVSNCIFSNYRRKWGKVNYTEVYEARGRDGEPCDVAEADLARTPASGALRVDASMAVESLTSYLVDRLHTAPGLQEPQLLECIKAMGDGDNGREISVRLGLSERDVQGYVRYIKNGSRQWRAVRDY